MSVVLERPRGDDAIYDDVIQLAKTARNTVGFLPDAAFAQRAAQGTLLAAINDGRLAGYVLYDLPRDEIRIVQLVVAPDERGGGIARRLLDAVALEHSQRRGMLLHCRNDFPAHNVWDKLDFLPVGERPGKSFDGKPLTRWFRPFGQPDLFTFLEESDTRPLAVLDSCVFFDVVAERPKPIAQQLRADWLGEHVRLAVTDQLLVEIRDGVDPDERRRERAAADPFRVSATPRSAWNPTYQRLLASHPDAPTKDRNDLIHVAQSIAMAASWLVTTDRQLIRRYGATAAELGLRLIAPAGFLREVDEQARGDRYRPVDLAGTDVTCREVGADRLADLSVFVNHADGERLRDLRARIDHAAARPDSVGMELIEVDTEPRGLVAWQVCGGALEVELIRGTGGRGEGTIGRHLLALVRDRAISSGVDAVRITDPAPSGTVQRSFRDEGFAPGTTGTVAHAFRGRGTLLQLRRRARKAGSPITDDQLLGDQQDDLVVRAAAAERWFAPFWVLDAKIPAFFVPIQHGWATRLLDSGLADDQLFPRDWGLGLRRELVYYRSPLNAGGLRAPARLLWYISGKAPGAGTIRAVSHLTEVTVDHHERLFNRFQALGVYSRADVADRADRRGLAMALRFSHTQRFRTPVSLDDFRRVVAGHPKAKSVVLRSVRPIDERVFVSLLDLGASS